MRHYVSCTHDVQLIQIKFQLWEWAYCFVVMLGHYYQTARKLWVTCSNDQMMFIRPLEENIKIYLFVLVKCILANLCMSFFHLYSVFLQYMKFSLFWLCVVSFLPLIYFDLPEIYEIPFCCKICDFFHMVSLKDAVFSIVFLQLFSKKNRNKTMFF